MNSKVVIATLIGGVAAFLLGYLIWGVVLHNFMAQNAGSASGVMKTDMQPTNMVFIFLGNLAFAYLLTYIFTEWASISTLAGGAKAGALIGFLMTANYDLIALGTSNILNTTGTIVDIVVGTVFSALVGAVIGAYLNMQNKA